MRKQVITLFVAAFLLTTTSAKAQIIDLVNDWTTTALPLGPTGTGFMDYTDDSCMFGFTTGPESSGVGILDTNGVPVTYPDLTVLDLTSEVQAVQVVDNHTYVSFFDEADAIFGLIRMDNATYGIAQVETAIPALYSDFTFVNGWWLNDPFKEIVFSLYKAKNTSTGKWTSLLLKYSFNKITNEFSEGQFIEINLPGKDTYPGDALTYQLKDVIISSYYYKDVDLENRDILITRVDENGEIVFKKTIAGYPGKDDEPIDLVTDSEDNIYCVTQSEDNAGINNHIVVHKINPANGKVVWTKRVGEAAPGSEVVNCASGNTLGGGLVFGGDVTDGAGGRNAKIWRMNASGNVIWNKTVNNTAAGTTETCKDLIFDATNGDVYAFGFSNDQTFISRYQSATGSSQYIKLDGIDGEGIVGKTSMGDVVCAVISNDGFSKYLTIKKYSEIVLRETSLTPNNEIICYPNPTINQLNIAGLKAQTLVQIINSTGQLLFNQLTPTSQLQINVEQFPAGQYQVILTNENTYTTQSFIKMD